MLKKKYYTGLQIHEAIDGVVGDYKKAIEIYRRLAKMETDDVQPVKHGKWIYTEVREYPVGYNRAECSYCNWSHHSRPGEKWILTAEEVARDFNYCPNCGAQMERLRSGCTE